ncbi:hypothetical protein [uncultured Thiocystis sp.]|jgi:hypothetical protein|uniref:hypothetical protein n=1 Tax=uncultured Thiocystis sp. TaxID=1202134 RepID=UPI0025D918FB|nr:hypothetical protein [uncultured Thiocystis sp.]
MLKKRVESLEQRDSGSGLPSLAESLLAARGRTLPRAETTNPVILAARERVERMRT